MGETMRIGLLGALQVRDTAGREIPVGGRRARMLIVMLALDAGHVVPASSLIGRLWPDGLPGDAGNALQSLVSRLRTRFRAAGADDGLIESGPGGYRLAVPPEAVDAIAFGSRARAGALALASGEPARAATLLDQALGLWRGTALADVADEDFAGRQAARLGELREAAVLDRIEAGLALGEGTSLVSEVRAIVAADPLAERPRALLMRALYADGRQAEALRVYQEAREVLGGQLGVDPSPQLEEVYLGVLRQTLTTGLRAAPAAHRPSRPGSGRSGRDQQAPGGGVPGQRQPGGLEPDVRAPADGEPAGARPRPRLTNVREPLTSFVGRDTEVRQVVKLLADERLVTLTGPGGVGKTRLAAEVSARLGAPVLFVELARVTDPAQVPYAVLGALGIGDLGITRKSPEAGAADPVDRLCDALAGREMVLVIDNCEHVVDAAAGLAGRLLADCPLIRIMATSREPLRIGGETLRVVSPLPVPPTQNPRPVPASEILLFPAVQLLRDRGASIVPGFDVNDGNADAAVRICRALDGMPLAIELAAVWLRTLTPAKLAERLDDRFALLTSGSRTALPRHQTLRAVVDWSWDLLSGPERTLARRLAVFTAGVTLAVAEQVCADQAVGRGALPRGAVLPALSGLVSKSIITVRDDRYEMLETVRAYGLERLAEAGEEEPTRDALASYYLNLVETADPLLRTADQMRWFRELSAEQDNAHAALRWAIARRDADTALRFVRALGYYWVQRGRGEGDALAREVLALGPPREDTLRMAEARAICALLAAGWSYDIESVREPLREAIAGLDRWSADFAKFHPIAAMAEPMLELYDGGHERALARFGRYLTVDDPWMRAMARLYRASYTATLGGHGRTYADCEEALSEFRAIGDKWGTSITLAQLAEFDELRGDHAAAIAALEEAAGLGREIGVWADIAYIEARLALIRGKAGEIARARAELDRAMCAVAERRYSGDVDRYLGFMRAELAWLEGDLSGVTHWCETVLAIIADLRAAWWQSLRAQVTTRLAMVALAQGDVPRCRERLAEALRAASGWVERPPLAAVLDAMAAYVLRIGPRGDAGLAATLLGAAHSVRGAFDESSPDAPAARAAARKALGARAFETAYQRGRELDRTGALTLATEVAGQALRR